MSAGNSYPVNVIELLDALLLGEGPEVWILLCGHFEDFELKQDIRRVTTLVKVYIVFVGGWGREI
jgi:hypothetical protein